MEEVRDALATCRALNELKFNITFNDLGIKGIAPVIHGIRLLRAAQASLGNQLLERVDLDILETGRLDAGRFKEALLTLPRGLNKIVIEHVPAEVRARVEASDFRQRLISVGYRYVPRASSPHPREITLVRVS